MIKIKPVALSVLIGLMLSCHSSADKNDFEHHYIKYWDKYSEKQLTDTLFSDTLNVGPDAEGGQTAREFYVNNTKELLADLQDDQKKTDSLYPMAAFDELTIRKLPLGLKKTFTKKQTEEFLKIINNPVSFDWAETTYEPEFQIDFTNNSKTVASMTIGADQSTIQMNPGWPNFKKMKFGHLKPEISKHMTRLIHTIE
ncbi:hypothetical protein SAMN05421594_1233 [Chryseobacterium oleae]|uniref:DUF3828 domain-containing protein n=1 Tax=Chryseobacterium oleae TaxID=491207 RepID=A0A1I4WIZ8_CHROL|nr:hypothetical protein [Chryseobacterium oleae]SFN13223.1 hypothetical protein SAMN05421594_1233 [Chryseobacterium oleae]